jgi:hypothetical protein
MHVPGRGIAHFASPLTALQFGVRLGRERVPSWFLLLKRTVAGFRLRPLGLRGRRKAGSRWWATHASETELWILVLTLGVIVGLVVARL